MAGRLLMGIRLYHGGMNVKRVLKALGCKVLPPGNRRALDESHRQPTPNRGGTNTTSEVGRWRPGSMG
jgi:hypothetical protein